LYSFIAQALEVYKRENRTFIATSPTIKQDLRRLSKRDLWETRCLRFVVGREYGELPNDDKEFLKSNKLNCFNSQVKIVWVFTFEETACQGQFCRWKCRCSDDAIAKWAGQSRDLMSASWKGVDIIELGSECTVVHLAGKMGFAKWFSYFAARRDGQVARREGAIFTMDMSKITTSIVAGRVPPRDSIFRMVG
jgi:hypothetical protein